MTPEKRYFYILGFPRSRSTWFSQFLSTNVSRCYHEIMSGNNLEAFNVHMLPYDSPYVGSADTNPISFSRILHAPGPMVMIYREPEKALHSIRKAFDKHEAYTDDEWEEYTYNMIEMYEIALEWYKENEPNLLYVDFEEMEDDQMLMRIFKHCIPAYDPDWSYIKYMNNLRITIKSKQGLRNGIEQSRKNVGKTIDEFKLDHLGNYSPEKFREDFWSGMETVTYVPPGAPEPSILVDVSGPSLMGARN